MEKRKLVTTIDEEVFLRLKIYAARERITMSSIVEDAMRNVLGMKEPVKKKTFDFSKLKGGDCGGKSKSDWTNK